MSSILLTLGLLLWIAWLLVALVLGRWLKALRKRQVQRTQREIMAEAMALKPARRWRHGPRGWRAPL